MSRNALRRASVVVASLAIASAGLLAGGQAVAATNTETASTPVPIVSPDGQLMSYVLNARIANPGQTRLLESAAEKAGGVVVQSWPEIGVVVAHATRAAFRADATRYAGNALESIGATRTVAVSEGTPAGVPASWGNGASGYKNGAKKPANGDVPGDEAPAAATDPNEVSQWDMQMIKADQAHAITDGSRSVLVGVLDSGIDPDHPDLVANIDVADSVNCTTAGRPDTSPTGWYPTTSDHGTHVSGTIAAARNGVGIVGVAPNVRLASVKVVNDDGFIYPEYAVCGFIWAGLHKMDVTNNSYYVDPFRYYCDDQADQHAAKEAVRRAVTWATSRGVISAAAAGNESDDLANKTTDNTSPDDSTPILRQVNSTCNDIPTEVDGVVTVASLQRVGTGLDSRLSGFSNRGLGVIDVAAPGSSILSTIVAGNGYGLKSGTSMASPHVAGVLALLKSVHPSWTPAQLLAQLKAQADDKACNVATAGAVCVGPDSNNSYFGDGIVDALHAVS